VILTNRAKRMDKETASQQIAAITKALEDVTKDLKLYSSIVENGRGTDLESIGKVSQSHTNLIASVRCDGSEQR
jgi:hypothetical protein